MTTVLFCGIPLHGHTNPTLELVKHLVSHGMNVIYYSGDEFKERVELTGAEFRSYGTDLHFPQSSGQGQPGAVFGTLLATCSSVMNRLKADFDSNRPDCILHDSFSVWGRQLALTWNIPEICLVTTFAADTTSLIHRTVLGIFYMRRVLMVKGGIRSVARFTKECAVDRAGFVELFQPSRALKIVYSSRYFQPGEGFDESFRFIGPSISTRAASPHLVVEPEGTSPLVYVSMGTIHNRLESFYRCCIDALRSLDVRVVMSVGYQVDIEALGHIPKQFVVLRHVPQIEVLSRASLFITHGGMNSVSEGLCQNVPLIVIPVVGDQHITAMRVQSLGAGIWMGRRTVTSATLRAAVKRVLSQESFRTNAKQIGDSLRTAGGAGTAVDEIRRYVQESTSQNT